jgi:hypothetical protein
LAQRLAHLCVGEVEFVSHPAQRLADDPLCLDRCAKQACSHIRHLLPLFAKRTAAGQRRRGANTLEPRVVADLPDTAHQQGDVRSLAAPVGVEFVEHQELKTAGKGSNDLMIARASEEQLEHDVVGQQDIGRVGQDFLPFLFFLLARIAPESSGWSCCGRPFDEEFFQFLLLAVGQGIHRIDDNGPNALATPLPEHKIDNWENIR